MPSLHFHKLSETKIQIPEYLPRNWTYRDRREFLNQEGIDEIEGAPHPFLHKAQIGALPRATLIMVPATGTILNGLDHLQYAHPKKLWETAREFPKAIDLIAKHQEVNGPLTPQMMLNDSMMRPGVEGAIGLTQVLLPSIGAGGPLAMEALSSNEKRKINLARNLTSKILSLRGAPEGSTPWEKVKYRFHGKGKERSEILSSYFKDRKANKDRGPIEITIPDRGPLKKEGEFRTFGDRHRFRKVVEGEEGIYHNTKRRMAMQLGGTVGLGLGLGIGAHARRPVLGASLGLLSGVGIPALLIKKRKETFV